MMSIHARCFAFCFFVAAAALPSINAALQYVNEYEDLGFGIDYWEMPSPGVQDTQRKFVLDRFVFKQNLSPFHRIVTFFRMNPRQ